MGKSLLEVLKGKTASRRPVWLMRQAGRYLPEYREVREKAGSFLKLCYDPQLASEVTLQPLRRFDLDAAIVFADILVVPHAMGCSLDFVEGEGPVVSTVRDSAAVARLGRAERAPEFDAVYETLRLTRAALPPDVTLIGFCGAPWTVASYMVEGGSSDRLMARTAANESAPWFVALIDALVDVSVSYLLGQVRAGAEVLQIFDSWAGDLPPSLRQRWVYAPIKAIMSGVSAVYPDVPIIVFARGIGGSHDALGGELRPAAVGVEQDVDMAGLLARLPDGVAVQGNLPPELLVAGGEKMIRAIKDIVTSVPKDRHVFNLGHGIVPQTPPEHVALLVDTIRLLDRGSA